MNIDVDAPRCPRCHAPIAIIAEAIPGGGWISECGRCGNIIDGGYFEAPPTFRTLAPGLAAAFEAQAAEIARLRALVAAHPAAVEAALAGSDARARLLNEIALFIGKYAGIDGAHHKQWLLDQVLRKALDTGYDDFIAAWEEGDEEMDDYCEWDTGVAP